MRDFLKAVQAGRNDFEANGDSQDALVGFQPIVHAAKEAKRRCFVAEFVPHTESYTGLNLVDSFYAQGLTEAGAKELARLGQIS